MKTACITTMVMITLAGATLRAETLVTAGEAIALALKNNPELEAARQTIDEARARLDQAALWPNPELETESKSDRTFNDEGETSFGVSISQPFSVSGRIGAQKVLARVELQQAMAEVSDRERQVIAEIRRVFVELSAVDEEIKLREFIYGLNTDLLKAVQSGLESGQVSETDVNAVLIALQQDEQQKNKLAVDKRGLHLELSRLTGGALADDAALEYTDAVPAFEAFTLEQALAQRPDYKAAQLGVELARAAQREAKAERFEDWRIGAGYERDKSVVNGAPPQGTDRFWGLKLSVPLPIFNRNQGLIRGTRIREERALLSVEAARLRISQELNDALNRSRSYSTLVTSYHQDILDRAEKNVRLVEGGYRQGLLDIVRVIQSRQQFAELKTSYIETRRAYQMAVVNLDAAAGHFPDAIKFNEVDAVEYP